MKDPNRRSPLEVRPVSLVVGGLLVLLGYLIGSNTSSHPAAAAAAGKALLDEVPRLRQELGSLQSSLAAAASPCPTCSCPAPVACADQQQQQQQQQQQGCDLYGKYNLNHLDQPPSQDVVGPVQDDEALFLYSLVRSLRLSRVLEIGGLSGYSARNFLQAMEPTQGVVYTVDIRKVAPVDSTRHICIQKDAALLDAADVDNQPLDLVFFDAHALDPQWNLYRALLKAGAITNYTLLVFHDTNTHPHKVVRWSFQNNEGGWVHHTVEGKMVNKFHDMGWDAFMLHPRKEVHSKEFPYRHGVVVMQRFSRLNVKRKRGPPGPPPP